MADSSGSCNQNRSKNQDFIPFSSSPQSRFTPSNCSSPVKNNYRKKWNQSPNYNYNQSHNNSSNRFSSPYNRNFNNSRNNSWSKNYNNSNGSNDISSFLHPSFIEDPWKKLEEEFKRKNLGQNS